MDQSSGEQTSPFMNGLSLVGSGLRLAVGLDWFSQNTSMQWFQALSLEVGKLIILVISYKFKL